MGNPELTSRGNMELEKFKQEFSKQYLKIEEEKETPNLEVGDNFCKILEKAFDTGKLDIIELLNPIINKLNDGKIGKKELNQIIVEIWQKLNNKLVTAEQNTKALGTQILTEIQKIVKPLSLELNNKITSYLTT